jgi:hypothetical protein
VAVCAMAIELPASNAVATNVEMVCFKVMTVNLSGSQVLVQRFDHGASNPWGETKRSTARPTDEVENQMNKNSCLWTHVGL